LIGLIRAVAQRIKEMLNMFDPTILPIAISEFFLYAATTEVKSSGRLVPIATIVKPIIV
jgi:hypothetical protein